MSPKTLIINQIKCVNISSNVCVYVCMYVLIVSISMYCIGLYVKYVCYVYVCINRQPPIYTVSTYNIIIQYIMLPHILPLMFYASSHG